MGCTAHIAVVRLNSESRLTVFAVLVVEKRSTKVFRTIAWVVLEMGGDVKVTGIKFGRHFLLSIDQQ